MLESPYEQWILNNVDNPIDRCKEFCEAMLKEFPELALTRGYYFDFEWGQREHWWLTDPQGNVIDPTARQFPSKGCGFYEPWNEGDPEPIEKCVVCGEYIYEGDSSHDEHISEYVAELNSCIRSNH